MLGIRKNSLAQVLNRELTTTRELIHDQHQEFMSYQARRDQEAKRRDREAKRRDEEAKRRDLEAKRREKEFQRICEEGERRTAEMREDGEKRTAEMREDGEKRTAEMREFMREILLRNEKVYTAVIAEMEKQGKRLDEGTAQLAANTRAVLSVLDRLNGSAPAT